MGLKRIEMYYLGSFLFEKYHFLKNFKKYYEIY